MPNVPINVMEVQTENPNDIKTKRNKTMNDQIRGDCYRWNPETSFGRSCVQ
jgi:hypothetical protein